VFGVIFTALDYEGLHVVTGAPEQVLQGCHQAQGSGSGEAGADDQEFIFRHLLFRERAATVRSSFYFLN
jgi:hypothetical protein